MNRRPAPFQLPEDSFRLANNEAAWKLAESWQDDRIGMTGTTASVFDQNLIWYEWNRRRMRGKRSEAFGRDSIFAPLPVAEPAASLFFLHENETFPFHLRRISEPLQRRKWKVLNLSGWLKTTFESINWSFTRGAGREGTKDVFYSISCVRLERETWEKDVENWELRWSRYVHVEQSRVILKSSWFSYFRGNRHDD